VIRVTQDTNVKCIQVAPSKVVFTKVAYKQTEGVSSTGGFCGTYKLLQPGGGPRLLANTASLVLR
jgi:hypothetical protein